MKLNLISFDHLALCCTMIPKTAQIHSIYGHLLSYYISHVPILNYAILMNETKIVVCRRVFISINEN